MCLVFECVYACLHYVNACVHVCVSDFLSVCAHVFFFFSCMSAFMCLPFTECLRTDTKEKDGWSDNKEGIYKTHTCTCKLGQSARLDCVCARVLKVTPVPVHCGSKGQDGSKRSLRS